MENIRQLRWPLVVGLGVIALVRPLMSAMGLMDRLGRPTAPLLVTLIISIVWIAVVGWSRVRQPVLTLVFAGIVYGVLSIILSGVLSPILTGHLQGPLANPLAVIPVLVVNAIWGAITGAIAQLVQQVRQRRRGHEPGRADETSERADKV